MKYDYQCKCGKKKTIEAPIGKAQERIQCDCGGVMDRYIIPPRVIFSGDGFSLNKMR